MSKSGKVIIVSAPSGAGKTTLAKHLLDSFKNLSFSVSATTREPRKGEEDGKDYYFLSNEKFALRLKEDSFLEWEEVYRGLYYGTPKSEVKRIWGEGKVVLLDIDVKGAINVMKMFDKKHTLGIFIKTPSLEELENRIRARRSETEETIAKRLDKAKEELTFENHFENIIVNDDLETSKQKIESLVKEFLVQ